MNILVSRKCSLQNEAMGEGEGEGEERKGEASFKRHYQRNRNKKEFELFLRVIKATDRM